MSDISDEVLMAFVDDELDAETRAQVVKSIASDPKTQLRVAAFEQTGRGLADLFSRPLHEPVPVRLLETVARRPAILRTTNNRPRAAQSRQWNTTTYLTMAATLAGVMCAGLGLLWFKTLDPFAPKAKPIAEASLSDALEATKSGETVALGGNGQSAMFKPIFSFAAIDRAYCRRYDILGSDGTQLSAVACRDATAKWRIEAQTTMTAKRGTDGAITPAGREDPPEIDRAIDKMISGDPFAASEEEQLISRHWQSQKP